ncbi:hypothetical protein DPMN_030994 [Dreissena polymorpha]|uniref:Uncharacterized protein n=1 Tax=Dreissena polymorpha TaxID=45954 RepID=A0A9D4RIL9_DREPO|nr:hypothetical protein DPMN_030994 [Dreissena polymorpha]
MNMRVAAVSTMLRRLLPVRMTKTRVRRCVNVLCRCYDLLWEGLGLIRRTVLTANKKTQP